MRSKVSRVLAVAWVLSLAGISAGFSLLNRPDADPSLGSFLAVASFGLAFATTLAVALVAPSSHQAPEL
ncbi:hypothetical protein [Rothia sp. P5764]|uniref:hypothetical protein n=1 Tax=unclassified Rothia (in: high G+C Gram-positive bacteria) TaxID=2689056 RepID=UPI003AC21682